MRILRRNHRRSLVCVKSICFANTTLAKSIFSHCVLSSKPCKDVIVQMSTEPKEEFFDIVNERDEIIGRATRSQVHAQFLRHRAVHVWIFNSRGNFLLQKRSLTKDTCPGTWTSSVCGHVDAGESYQEAVAREIREEIGLEKIPEFQEIAYEPASSETFMEFTRIYRAESEGPFRFPPEEISELRWMPPNQITRLINEHPDDFAPLFRHLWTRVQ